MTLEQKEFLVAALVVGLKMSLLKYVAGFIDSTLMFLF